MDIMGDLSYIGYVSHFIILVVLCRKPFDLLLLFSFGVYFVCISYFLTNDNAELVTSQWGTLDWFAYVKRASLFAGYPGYCFVYWYNSKASRIILQIILFLNVLEAGLYALEYLEIVAGILLICFSPFSPQVFVNKNNKTLLAKGGNLLQFDKLNYVSPKWYFRCYLIILGVWSLLSIPLNEGNYSIYAGLTCFIPLIMNEYFLNNFMNHFSVRTLSLIIITAIDSSFDNEYINKQPASLIPHDLNIILRNVITLCGIIFLFGLTMLNDKYRSSKNEPIHQQIEFEMSDQSQHDEAVQMLHNVEI